MKKLILLIGIILVCSSCDLEDIADDDSRSTLDMTIGDSRFNGTFLWKYSSHTTWFTFNGTVRVKAYDSYLHRITTAYDDLYFYVTDDGRYGFKPWAALDSWEEDEFREVGYYEFNTDGNLVLLANNTWSMDRVFIKQ